MGRKFEGVGTQMMQVLVVGLILSLYSQQAYAGGGFKACLLQCQAYCMSDGEPGLCMGQCLSHCPKERANLKGFENP